jgi:UPF0755 protein
MRISRTRRLLLAVALAAGFAFWRANAGYQGFEGEVFIDIPRGASAASIGRMLSRAGVVSSQFDFLIARLASRGRKLQAGEYRFDSPASPLEVYGRIARGDVFYYELVVPEGRNMFDIASSAEKLGAFRAQEFIEAARSPELIRDLDPKAPSLEGYLFPGSYRLKHNATAKQLCREMTGRFRQMWGSLIASADVHETVTLASLVEREAKVGSERPLIAAVFANRLRIGMKLDCDPTTIYAALLAGAYRGTIYESDLKRDSAYNTYRSSGLPPGPIANPGMPSIMAALKPAQSKALYFVLRPDSSGAHQFSENIAAHEIAVEKFRRGVHK